MNRLSGELYQSAAGGQRRCGRLGRHRTPREFAEALRVSEHRAREILASAELPVLELGPRIRRIPRAAFEEWICAGAPRRSVTRERG